MANIMTDNRNRTAGEVRHIFSKNGGNLGESGCVNWMFEEKGQLSLPNGKLSEDELMLIALEAGAEDLEQVEEGFLVYTAPAEMEGVRQALIDQGIALEEAVLNLVPQNNIEITDLDQAKKIIKLMELLEEHDDVQGVYANFDIAEAIEAEL